ncbi:MAG: peptidylprolyl isomerase [Gemmataceae bacterium]|nr:peptidylprolyl isomerase [Gemmataceae bacterium]MCS7269990.1 peptidylprolyl isomerase [Gemmataceae bacterium]MDW8242524.1 peptidylprolyl isomerase [Thermogemmata sp.]
MNKWWVRGLSAWMLGGTMVSIAAGQMPPATPSSPAASSSGPVAPATTSPAAASLPTAPTTIPNGPAAIVNGQTIPEKAVYRALRQFPPEHHQLARKEILAHLIENVLIDQYLTAIKVTVDPKEVDKIIQELKDELAAAKKDYNKELEALLLTEEEFRAEVTAQMKWEKFVMQQGTDEALKKLFDSNPEVFDGTMVRARHILINPGADENKQKEAAARLRGIKQVIEQEAAKAVAALPATADALAKEQARAAKIEELFAAYAKQYSECPSKKDGGDLNFFPRAGAMVEPFAQVAFSLKPYEMSDVVATEVGYHLILVTARKPGTPKKFEEVKEDVRLLFAMRLREAVIQQMRPRAQITIYPPPGSNPSNVPAGANSPPANTPTPPAGGPTTGTPPSANATPKAPTGGR